MLILISLYLFVASRGFHLAHSFTGSTATSGAGSLDIGVNGTDPLRGSLQSLEQSSSQPSDNMQGAYKHNF